MNAGIRFVFGQEDIDVFNKLKSKHPEYIVDYSIDDKLSGDVTDSSTRFGYYIMQADSQEKIISYLPSEFDE